MIDLTDISGLPIKFDEETGRLLLDDPVFCYDAKNIQLSEMVSVLLNKYLKYPEVVYRHHKNIALKDDISLERFQKLSYDIVQIPYGLLGIEFIRTHIYHSPHQEGKYDAVVQVLSGELTIFLQKNSDFEDPLYEQNTVVDEVVVITLQQGEKFIIPTGYFYTFVNTGLKTLVFSKITARNHDSMDYNIIKKERGLAYYVISKNARLEIVPNPKYKVLNTTQILTFSDLPGSKFFIEAILGTQQPLYNTLCDKYNEIVKSLNV